MKPLHFIRKPLKGDKIKVYLEGKHQFVYGIVQRVVLKNFTKNETVLTQEMVEVKYTDKDFDINDVNFFFDSNRVIFVQ